MLQNIQKLFLDLGLSENEGKTITTLLQHGSLKATDIARKTRIKRTTLYGVLKQLQGRGLISIQERFGVTEYQSIEPTLLPSYIEHQREALLQKKQEVLDMMPELTKVRSATLGFPKIQFFEGWDGLKQACEDSLENNRGKMIWDFTAPAAGYNTVGRTFLENFMKKRTQLGIKVAQIAARDEWSELVQSEDEKYLRKTYLIPKEYSIDTELAIYDNKVLMASFSKDQPVAVIVEDAGIAESLKKIFLFVEENLK